MMNENKKKAFYYFKAKYKPNKYYKYKVNILGKEFIKRNKNKCKIIYKSKIYELKEHFEDIDINYNHKDLIKLKLVFIHNIIDMSYMFYNCASLISLSINTLNISYLQMYIINMISMFYNCKSLKSLPDISKWNTSNVELMNNMFYKCTELISSSDLSKWDISNVKYMNNIFSGC